MVELYRFYDNTDTIYLLLQHAAGGRLWNYVGHFLQATGDAAAAVHDLGDVYDDEHEKRLRSHTLDTLEAGEEGDREGETGESEAGNIGTIELDKNTNTSRPRQERFDSALEDVDSLVLDHSNSNKDSLTLNPQLERVQYDASKDSDFLSLDGSHIAESFHNVLQSSLTGDETETGDKDMEGETNTFQSLLEYTRKQPLAGFTVDSSFDSDIDGHSDGPPSRQLSNTIDSIEEEPMDKPQELNKDTDSVFTPHKDASDKGGPVHSTPQVAEDSEPSIYDRQQPFISDSDDSDSVTCSGANQVQKSSGDTESPNVKTNSSTNPNLESTETNRTTLNVDGSANVSPKVDSEGNTPTSPTVFRQVSRERSADSRRRKRTLSAVFEELDLAEEEGRQQQQQRLPEACVRQWAAELVVAVDSLHQAGIICRYMKISYKLIESVIFSKQSFVFDIMLLCGQGGWGWIFF